MVSRAALRPPVLPWRGKRAAIGQRGVVTSCPQIIPKSVQELHMAMIKLRTKGSKIVTPEIPGVMCKNAKCPTRGQAGTYRKSEILSLQVERIP